MGTEGLKIVIGADIGSAVVGISKLTNAMQGISSEAAAAAGALNKIPVSLRPVNPAQMQALRTAVAKLKDDIAAFPKNPIPDPFKNIPKGANQASAALTDIGRIAQDLPFGIIAIQNNLNPLVESFGRLRETTGSNKAAFAALGQSLLGPGGIGFALSAVTAAFLIYQNGIAGFNKKTKEAKDEADKLAELLKSVKSSTEAAFAGEGNSLGQIAQVKALAAAVTDETKSQIERKRALEQLKSANKAYFGDLKLQENSLKALTPLVNEYSNAIIQQAIVSELSSEIGKLGAVYLKQKKAVKDARDALNDYKDSLGIPEVNKAGERTFVLDNNLDQLTATLTAAQKTLQPTAQKFNDLSQAISDATVEGLKFKSTSTDNEKEVDLIKKRIDALKQLQSLTGLTSNQQVELAQLEIKIAQRDAAKVGFSKEELQQQIQGILEQAFPVGTFEFDTVVTTRVNSLEPSKVQDAKALTDGFKTDIAKAVGLDGKPLEVPAPPITFTGVDKELQKAMDDFKKTMKEQVGQVADVFAEAFANIFTGENVGSSLANAARGLMEIIGDILQQAGKNMILASAAVEALTTALSGLFGPGGAAAGIAAGALLITTGALIKKILPPQHKFAEGGIVTGPIIGQIGEMHKPEVVMPLDRLKALLGSGLGQNNETRPVLLINNEGLWFAMKQGERSAGRKI